MDRDDDDDERCRRSSALVRQHADRAVARGMVSAMRSLAGRLESIERAVALQAAEIERLDRVLVETMRRYADDQLIAQDKPVNADAN